MTFTSGAADHQHTHGEKSRKFFTNRINQSPWPARNSFHQILLYKKERLDAAHLSGEIAQNQVLIVEIIGQCLLNDFVEAMVFAAVVKSAGPVSIFLNPFGGVAGRVPVLKRNFGLSSHAFPSPRLRHFSVGVPSAWTTPVAELT